MRAIRPPALSRPCLIVARPRSHSCVRCFSAARKEPIDVGSDKTSVAPPVSDSSPSDGLVDDQPLRVRLATGSDRAAAAAASDGGGLEQKIKVAWRRALKEIASLPLAISIMFTIAGLSGLGTIIPQNKARFVLHARTLSTLSTLSVWRGVMSPLDVSSSHTCLRRASNTTWKITQT